MSRNDNVNDDDDGLGDNTKFCLKLVCLTFYYYSRGYIWCTCTRATTRTKRKKIVYLNLMKINKRLFKIERKVKKFGFS